MFFEGGQKIYSCPWNFVQGHRAAAARTGCLLDTSSKLEA